ncbi:prepilin-type N-terminal cleavage/methylation domain-containing protein [bacterium]|nr:prepilin-type N-terminal cleavage/methylation domain-containing protein [bacterium]
MRHHQGYTLTELLVASAVSAMALSALIALYLNGKAALRMSVTQTWAQQRALSALHTVAERTRPASRFEVYPGYAQSFVSTSQVAAGRCVNLYGAGWTSKFHVAGGCLWHNTVAGLASSNSLAASVGPATVFSAGYQRLHMTLILVDPADTNRELVRMHSSFMTRNSGI